MNDERLTEGRTICADSFIVVAGTRCEVQQTERAREIEVIPLRFVGEGTGWVLAGAGARFRLDEPGIYG
jgi:hypothetical protein